VNEVFSYQQTKDGKVFISWQGRTVTTLAGNRAATFMARADGLDSEGLQQLMARATGNFKHGNER
jgi:hypothetical protein